MNYTAWEPISVSSNNINQDAEDFNRYIDSNYGAEEEQNNSQQVLEKFHLSHINAILSKLPVDEVKRCFQEWLCYIISAPFHAEINYILEELLKLARENNHLAMELVYAPVYNREISRFPQNEEDKNSNLPFEQSFIFHIQRQQRKTLECKDNLAAQHCEQIIRTLGCAVRMDQDVYKRLVKREVDLSFKIKRRFSS